MPKPKKFVYAPGRLRHKNQGEREYHVQKKKNLKSNMELNMWMWANIEVLTQILLTFKTIVG